MDVRNVRCWNKFWDYDIKNYDFKNLEIGKWLRAIISWILFSNKLSPDGYFSANEDMDPSRDPEFNPDSESLETLEGWV